MRWNSLYQDYAKTQYGNNDMGVWLKEMCELTGIRPPIKGKPRNHGGHGDGILKSAEDHVTLVEATTSARQEGVVEHGGHI
jgi:hypothetical protein